MKIVIIEDDFYFVDSLKIEIQKYFHDAQIEVYHDFNQSIYFQNNDILFLDIMINEEQSFCFGASLLNQYPSLILVYMSRYDHFVYDTYNQRTFYFLRKTYLTSEFKKFYNKYQTEITNSNKVFSFMFNNIQYTLFHDEIIYIESYRNKLSIYTLNNVYHVYMTLKEIYDVLDNPCFYKFNRSTIINFKNVINYDHKAIYLTKYMLSFTKKSKANFIENYGRFRRGF